MFRKYFVLLQIFSLFPLFTAIFGHAHEKDLENVFSEIYENGLWGFDENGEGHSGGGSDPKSVQPYLDYVNLFLKKFDIQTILDIGCGDFRLGRRLHLDKRSYIGIDAASNIIKKNQIRFGSEHVRFLHGNAITTPLPNADLLICKDVLQHLSIKNIYLMLEKFSKYKYCLITNDVSLKNSNAITNAEIPNGSWRPLDLTLFPFNVSAIPVLIMKSGDHVKVTLLIKGKDLEGLLENINK